MLQRLMPAVRRTPTARRRPVARRVLWGAAAGAAGTAGLNLTTYLDMALRGRPASGVPAKAAERLAAKVGVDLSGADGDAQTPQARASALGSLLGFATGLGLGCAFGALHPRVAHRSFPALSLGLAAAATVGTSAPMAAMGVTEPPTRWGAKAWMADLPPHLAYGLVTAAVYEVGAGRWGVIGGRQAPVRKRVTSWATR